MKTKIVLFVLCSVLFYSCKKQINNTNLLTETLNIDGSERRYIIYTPEGINDTKIPLVFELHGGGAYIEDVTGQNNHGTPYKLWMTLADSENFIVVYPEGLGLENKKPTWNDCRADCIFNSTANDVHFIDSLINLISSEYKVDLNRVYVSGISNGGFMAQRLGIELNSKIAAFASVAALKPAVSECRNPNNPVSVLFMAGTDDNFMPYNGGNISNPPDPDYGTVLSAEETINYWINFNRTDTVPEIYTFPDKDTNDGGIVEKFTYKNGESGTEVVLYKINGGGHSAPSIKEQYSILFEQIFNKQNHDIETTAEIWNFFKNHTLK